MLETTAHELGHCLGLGHSKGREDLMYYATKDIMFTSVEFSETDKRRIQELYGAPTKQRTQGDKCGRVGKRKRRKKRKREKRRRKRKEKKRKRRRRKKGGKRRKNRKWKKGNGKIKDEKNRGLHYLQSTSRPHTGDTSSYILKVKIKQFIMQLKFIL